jgi:CRISPR type IV-associated protein Csf1
VKTTPQLLAAAHGVACEGPLSCFYCGAPCDGTHPAAEHVKDSFTGRPGVRAPGSPAVCRGCVLCLREDAEVDQIDGQRRRVTKACMRAFSWVVTRDSARAGSKAHLDHLRAVCLNPPPPPFAIVLSDSGQTHQLYRGVVNHASDPIVVTLEAEPIAYRTATLSAALALCGKLCAATGKPALREPVDFRLASAAIGRYRDGESLLSEWSRLQATPLGRLAAWLVANKETCAHEFPADLEPPSDPPAAPGPGHGGVPPQAGGAGRSARKGGRHAGREGGGEAGRTPFLFDLG